MQHLSDLLLLCSVTGDGGNDVSMIQAADCGIGIEGKVMAVNVKAHNV